LIRKVTLQKKNIREGAVIVFLHWSFDLETLPFPMYRQFSRSLIDAGADLVIGTHSHCVQGGEKYRSGYIFYGLGNFFIPYDTFAGRQLTFPDFARMQLAVEWDCNTGSAVCHWFEYSGIGTIHRLKHIESGRFEDSSLLKRYTPYADMPDKEYMNFFRKHRRKSLLMPIYKDYKMVRFNEIYTYYLMKRARLAHFLAEMKIRKWQK